MTRMRASAAAVCAAAACAGCESHFSKWGQWEREYQHEKKEREKKKVRPKGNCLVEPIRQPSAFDDLLVAVPAAEIAAGPGSLIPRSVAPEPDMLLAGGGGDGGYNIKGPC